MYEHDADSRARMHVGAARRLRARRVRRWLCCLMRVRMPRCSAQPRLCAIVQ